MNKNKIDTTKLPTIEKLLRMDPASCYDYLKKNKDNLTVAESKSDKLIGNKRRIKMNNQKTAREILLKHAWTSTESYDYLPTTDKEAAEFLPHEWAVRAVTEALEISSNPFDKNHEEILSKLEDTANFIRGMAADSGLSVAQREALTKRVHGIDSFTEAFNEAY
jgi:hypothetical protein